MAASGSGIGERWMTDDRIDKRTCYLTRGVQYPVEGF